MNIFVNNKNSFYKQYEFKIINIDTQYETKKDLLDFLSIELKKEDII